MPVVLDAEGLDALCDHRPPERFRAVLHGAGADSRDMVDAHIVAVCALHGGGLVVTADSDDIERLAQAVPSARVLTCRAG